MEQYKETLRMKTILMGISCIMLLIFSILGFGNELGWFTVFQPLAGDSHWHSYWYGLISGGSIGIFMLLLYFLIRNIRAMKNERKLKTLYIKENDERMLKIWTHARSAAMQVTLLIGMVVGIVSGYFSRTVSLTILICVLVSSSSTHFFHCYFNKKF